MKRLCLLIGIFISFSGTARCGEVVSNPIADFANYPHTPGAKLLKLEADLNHSGKKIIFLSRSDLWAGKGGNIWSVYIPVAGGFEKVEETDQGNIITFRPDHYFIGRVPGVKGGDVLLMFNPSGGGKGVLVGYQIVDNKIHETTINDNFEPAGAGKKLYKKTLGSGFQRSVEELDFPK